VSRQAARLQATGRASEGPLLEITDVSTSFVTEAGVVGAVNGVSLSLERGKSLGVVGESAPARRSSPARSWVAPRRGVIIGGSVVRGPRAHDAVVVGAAPHLGRRDAMIFQDR
jgi:peptide/nickel transport system ATP-binding protein